MRGDRRSSDTADTMAAFSQVSKKHGDGGSSDAADTTAALSHGSKKHGDRGIGDTADTMATFSQGSRKHGVGESSDAADTMPASPQETDTLRVLLKDRRYLLVLDGLVGIGNWNCLLDQLPRQTENPEGRILVTTQLNHNEIIKHTQPKMEPTKLDRLKEATQTFQLFRQRMFGADTLKWKQVQEDFSARVHNVTRGLPLAVIVLAGILRTKAYPSEWKEVFAEKLETSIGEAKAMRCLWLLAFEELPNHLKSCFLYLATASENIRLDPARLVRLWIAEGFVAPSYGQMLEEVGLGYLKELICRGLIELVEKDAKGGIKEVTAHSLLHSFVQAEAQESGFQKIHHNANVLNRHAVRRLAIHNFVDSFVDIPDGLPKLRSLLCDFLKEEQGGSSGGPAYHGPKRQGPRRNLAEWLFRACGGSIEGPAADAKTLHQLSIIRESRFLRVIDLYGVLLQTVPEEIGSIIRGTLVSGTASCLSYRDPFRSSITSGLWA